MAISMTSDQDQGQQHQLAEWAMQAVQFVRRLVLILYVVLYKNGTSTCVGATLVRFCPLAQKIRQPN